jgi:hypothetical protein
MSFRLDTGLNQTVEENQLEKGELERLGARNLGETIRLAKEAFRRQYSCLHMLCSRLYPRESVLPAACI